MDITDTITPKSDQLNADDLTCGPISIKITKMVTKSGDQPVSLHFEGDNGRPYKPNLSMRRVIVECWAIKGTDGKLKVPNDAVVGRSMTLYRDPKVTWAKSEVGGIKISHMSHIEKEVKLVLTVSRGIKAPHIVKPFVAETMASEEQVEAIEEYKAIETTAEIVGKAFSHFGVTKALELTGNQAARIITRCTETLAKGGAE